MRPFGKKSRIENCVFRVEGDHLRIFPTDGCRAIMEIRGCRFENIDTIEIDIGPLREEKQQRWT